MHAHLQPEPSRVAPGYRIPRCVRKDNAGNEATRKEHLRRPRQEHVRSGATLVRSAATAWTGPGNPWRALGGAVRCGTLVWPALLQCGPVGHALFGRD
jgi:hypothetical protein